MDIFFIETEKNIQICPKSIFGMLWLQTHFEKDYWPAIALNQVSINKLNMKELAKDAKAAGIRLNFLPKLCITSKF